jgi:hypothetical protein
MVSIAPFLLCARLGALSKTLPLVDGGDATSEERWLMRGMMGLGQAPLGAPLGAPLNATSTLGVGRTSATRGWFLRDRSRIPGTSRSVPA